MVAEAKALAALGDRSGLDATIAEAMVTPMVFTPANVLVEAAATAGAHGRPELSRNLALRAVRIFESDSEVSVGPWDRILFAEALVHLGRFDRAQVVLKDLLPEVRQRPGYVPLVVRGWLGTVAARRGDLETARSMDRELAGIDDPYLYGGPFYYRAAITAWLGHREEAVDLLQAARSEGWSAFYQLHDEDRVFFEPLEGMAEFEEMLHPTE